MMKHILVVGAGFSGVTVARVLAEAGHRVLVIDKRPHVAGNAHDEVNAHGIRVHTYGPHLFHTNNEEVWNFLGRFTTWLPYKHKVMAELNSGELVTLPVNRETAEIVGKENVLDIFFRPYTRKMWGVELEQLSPDILNRVPIRDDDNVYYFPNDKFQGLPDKGYKNLILGMLNHPNITWHTSTDFSPSMLDYLDRKFDHVFTSQPIDEYYNFIYGELPYRSIKFHTVTLPTETYYQPVTTVNYTNDGPFTRITEWKHLPGHGKHPYLTTLTYEEPCDYKDNDNQRFYPVKDLAGANRETYLKYRAIENPSTTFIGRCGLYTYLDMHDAVASALKIARDYLKPKELTNGNVRAD